MSLGQLDPEAAVDKMADAISDEEGRLLPIDRIELEILEGRRVRWNLWAAGRRVYSVASTAEDLAGFLSATELIVEIRAEEETDGTTR